MQQRAGLDYLSSSTCHGSCLEMFFVSYFNARKSPLFQRDAARDRRDWLLANPSCQPQTEGALFRRVLEAVAAAHCSQNLQEEEEGGEKKPRKLL